ncbi:hypothetical protein [Aliarcobacter butzleri]|uniref:hypothetical protein n=1 Tax=Aliarcobacter butzleri TaxID=28197 RepID=UPI0012610B8F|nr:hypothetical protein [Aliarcobacter butzleri]
MKKENIKKEVEEILEREATREEIEALFSFLKLYKEEEEYKLKEEITKIKEMEKKEIDKITFNFNKKIEEKENNFLKKLIKKSLKVLKIKNKNKEEVIEKEAVQKNFLEIKNDENEQQKNFFNFNK